jgi:hypothetical protein
MKSFGNIAKDSQVRAVASGTLSSGKPVVVNSDGTVSVVGIGVASVGSAVTFENATTAEMSATYDTANDKIVIAYRDSANSNYGTAIVGTVSGTSISFGSPVVFNSGSISANDIAFDSNKNKVVIVFVDNQDAAGESIVGTVSGTSISFGSEVQFASFSISSPSISFDSTSNKMVVAWYDSGNSPAYGKARVGNVTGETGTISYGTAATFNSGGTADISTSYDSSSDKTIIAFRDSGNSNQGTAIVGTVSGTSISFGSANTFETGTTQYTRAVYDSGNNKTNIFYMDGGDSDKGKAVIGTMSGTSISFTTPEVFYDAAINALTAVYDSNANTNVIGIRGNSAYGYAIPITSDGSSFTVGSSTTITTNAYGTLAASAFDPDEKKVVFAYQDGDDGDKGKAQVYNAAATTLTSENYIGMSSGVVNYDEATQAVGTSVIMNAGSTTGFAAAFDSNEGKVVVAYADNSGGGIKGKAAVGTVDAANNSISFGSEVTFQNSEITGDQMDCVFDSSNNKIVIFYQDTNNPSTNDRTGTAIVGTVSGTSISFGTKVAFESGHTDYISATFDSTNNRVVVFYRDEDNSRYGTAAVGTVSGTSISFGTPVVWNSANTAFISCSFDSNAGKILVVYKDVGNSNYGTSVVATVDPSDNSISFGSEVNFLTANGGHYETIFDSSANKHVVLYDNPNDSNHGYARVGTISGTSVSFGTEAEFENGAAEYMRGVFDSNAGKILILYKDGSNSNRPTIVIGTVSGTDVSFGTPVVVMDVEGITILPGLAFDSTNNKVVGSYIDTTGSDNGMAQVFQVAYDNTTRAQIANSGKAVIDSTNAISRNQNGLTAGQTYFVQTDGTLGLTAATPSVTAGTAISATELIVKG